MEVFEGQKEPLTLRWGSEGSGNPFELTDAEKAAIEVAEIKGHSSAMPVKPQPKKRTAKQIEKEEHMKKVREIRVEQREQDKNNFDDNLAK